jgi:alkylhydroperoxidase family enzyme
MPLAKDGVPAFEAWLAHRPELLALYKRFYATPWDDALLPPRLLELCRLRIAQLHDCTAELAVRDAASGVTDAEVADLPAWESSPRFSDAERAALAVAEKMPWAHHSIVDEEFAVLGRAFRQPEIVALTVALALFDANCRLRLVFELDAAPTGHPPSAGAPLH